MVLVMVFLTSRTLTTLSADNCCPISAGSDCTAVGHSPSLNPICTLFSLQTAQLVSFLKLRHSMFLKSVMHLLHTVLGVMTNKIGDDDLYFRLKTMKFPYTY